MTRSTWWHRHNADLAALPPADRAWIDADATLPPHVLALLDAVEARFAATRTVPDWPDPLADSRSPGGRRAARADEYSRVSHPERYAVLGERIEAWVDELAGRDLASVDEVAPPARQAPDAPVEGGDGWLLRPRVALDRVRVLRPRRPGALPLVLGSVFGTQDDHVAVVVAAGDPFVELALHPDCGCDACDSGSADLLRALDEELLPVVDGSLRVRMSARTTAIARSGGSQSSSTSGREVRDRRRVLGREPHELAGTPWDPAWPPRRPSPFA